MEIKLLSGALGAENKGINLKDTSDEIAKWIGHGITGYEKAIATRKKLQSFVEKKVEKKDDDLDDEVPF